MPCSVALPSTIILAVRCPPLLPLLTDSSFPVLDNIDLGTACGKYFRVGVLSITDAGDSDITQEMGVVDA